MNGGPVERDPVWRALEGVRESAVVHEARGYAHARLQRRERIAAWRRALFSWWAGAGVATAFAALAFVLLQPRADMLETGIGEIRRITLADGSVVTLNSGSKARVALDWRRREIELLGGEAQFDVARDAARPFRVTANGMAVTALGTSFDVVALKRRTAVTLIEGRVLVEEIADAGDTGDRRLAAPGQQVRLTGNGLTTPVTARLDSTLAWQRRLVDLSGLSLQEALDEVNRYSSVKVVVTAPDLQDAQFSGVFRAGDANAVAAALGVYFDLRVVHRDSTRIVLDRSAAGPAPATIAR